VRKANLADILPAVTDVLRRLPVGAPTDLRIVAQARRVQTVELRNMLLDGALEPTLGGFKIYLYEPVHECTTPVDQLGALTRRQRFTLAHELAHTFFFDMRLGTPAPLKWIPHYKKLEEWCNFIASELLVPDLFLRQRLKRTTPPSIEMIRALSDERDVSIDVILRRLSRGSDLVAANRALFLLESRRHDDAYILSCFFGSSMHALLRRQTSRQMRLWSTTLAALRPADTEVTNWEEVLPGLSFRASRQAKNSRTYLLELAPTHAV
jgi:Zn-dependent peptidase ImmA (M78 family)